MQLALRAIAVMSFIVAIIWMIIAPGFEPLLAFLAGISTLLVSFAVDRSKDKIETLDQRNRRVMLNHVENFWIKGILEKSLHGAALLQLGIKEDLAAVSYPWTIKKEATDEVLPPGKSMLEIFQEIGLGRSLLILGAPGSGKTTILLELARQLIERARQDETEPIPVVFNLASWNGQILAVWLAEQLNVVYYLPKKMAAGWVNENRMLLLLDGLDEVREYGRAKCVEAINQFRKEYGLTSIIVCSRMQEYEAIQTKLSLEGAIALQPLTDEHISNYVDYFGNRLWSVRLLLKRDSLFKELAKTPLMLSIMTIAYKNLPADQITPFDSIEDHRRNLFNKYIDRMFEDKVCSTGITFTRSEALRYLNWLAGMMIQHNIVYYDTHAMRTSWLIGEGPRRLYKLCTGLIYGLIFGVSIGLLFGLFSGLLFSNLKLGLFTGLIGSLVAGWLSGFALRRADEHIFTIVDMVLDLESKLDELIDAIRTLSDAKPHPKRRIEKTLFINLFWIFMVTLFFGLLGILSWLSGGLIGGLLIGLVGGLVFGWLGGSNKKLADSVKVGLVGGLFLGVVVGFIGGLSTNLISSLIFGSLFGLSVVLLFGTFGWTRPIHCYVMRWVLITQHLLPRQLIPFLEYCVSLIFLRRVGGSYIFVHRLLMEHFAEKDVRLEQTRHGGERG